MNEHEIFTLLGLRKFQSPEYVWLPQVGDGTGARAHRHMDAVALSTWPSRGVHLHAVEIKTSRSDWKREQADPAKAEPIAQYCHFMWLAVDGTARTPVIEHVADVPTLWGILSIENRGKGLIVKTCGLQHAENRSTHRGPSSPPFYVQHTRQRTNDSWPLWMRGYKKKKRIGLGGSSRI